MMVYIVINNMMHGYEAIKGVFQDENTANDVCTEWNNYDYGDGPIQTNNFYVCEFILK